MNISKEHNEDCTSISSMKSSVGTKRALLIGSGYNNLPGTDIDVQQMWETLRDYGFKLRNVKLLIGAEATRENILTGWKQLIRKCKKDDAVVIYYSGHGGYAERHQKASENDDSTPRQIQFLFPVNYIEASTKWTGIFDGEISHLLLRTTGKTSNVTYIIDSCHSARLGRRPTAFETWPKNGQTANYKSLASFFSKLRTDGKVIDGESWINHSVCRVAASAEALPAYQRETKHGPMGILTHALTNFLKGGQVRTSWRNVMLEVGAQVERIFPDDPNIQQPRSAGADRRIPFSMTVDSSKMYIADVWENNVDIRAGQIHGIECGFTFTLTPLTSDRNVNSLASGSAEETTVRVNIVQPFKSSASFETRKHHLTPDGLALARLKEKSTRWTMKLPECLRHFDYLVQESGFQKPRDDEEPRFAFELESRDGLSLYHHRKSQRTMIARLGGRAESDIQQLLTAANQITETYYLTEIQGSEGENDFSPPVQIEIEKCSDPRPVPKPYTLDILPKQGRTSRQRLPCFHAGDQYQITLRYLDLEGRGSCFVSVFRLNSAGQVHHISRSWTRGAEFGSSKSCLQLRQGTQGKHPIGMNLPWPATVPESPFVEETFLFVFTEEEVDLTTLEVLPPSEYLERKGSLGDTTIARKEPPNAFELVRLPYRLKPSQTKVTGVNAIHNTNIPAPRQDSEASFYGTLRQSPTQEKGLLGGIYRYCKSVPKFVRVINSHSEDITVVVSTYKPRPRFNSVNVGLGATSIEMGGAVEYFSPEATKKTLRSMETDINNSYATFPFATRRDGFGVITIYKGSDPEPFIQNDHVPLGAVVYFNGGPDLEVVLDAIMV